MVANAAILSSIIDCHQVSLKLDKSLVLNSINLSLNPGELTAVIGPNGAGKSSLLKVLSGETNCSRGRIDFHAKNINQWARKERAQYLAYLPQFNDLNFPFTVAEVVELARMPHTTGQQIDSEIIHAALACMDLLHKCDQLYTSLSGGEKQRTQLARVLAQVWCLTNRDDKAPILLLDEPCNALDPGHESLLIDHLHACCIKGTAVLMVQHDINFASRYAHRIIAMDRGKIVADGSPEQVIRQATLNSLFNTQGYVFSHPQLGHPIYL